MLTRLRRGGLLGKQEPRVSAIPAGLRDYSAGDDALDLADIAGRECMEFQRFAVREGMATDPATGNWVAFEVAWLVARQNGKNGGIEVVELGWMVNEPGISILHTAHEFQTALESMDKLESLIRSHPLLENEILSVRYGNGKESIRLKNGSIIRFRTRTKSGGRGFSVDRLVIDEAMIWSPASQAAIMPLLTTALRPQIWYLGSAADVETHEYCGKWASLRRRALAGGDSGLIWMEWSAPDPPTDELARDRWREDRENWAYANPAMGELLTEEYIEAEMRAFRSDLDKWEVERLSVGRWPSAGVIQSEIPADVWQTLQDSAPKFVGPHAVAVHRSPDRAMWVITAARFTESGRAHVEVGYHRAATNIAVVKAVIDVVAVWNPAAIVIKGRSEAAALQPLLIKAGVEPVMVNGAQVAQACGGFLDAVNAGRVSHSGQTALNNAVAAAVRHDLPAGGFVWDEDTAGPALMGATLAHWALLTFAVVTKPPPPPVFSTEIEGVSGDLDVFSAAF